ncbi:DUF6745 domain-containing protein [Argonema galeatum]|uniref:DUF6745 domain-containing protein n=1 Tax=Argonema galeatum TaxID=2942762 RepID=UPI0020110FE2|nr:hypothetical protein [Argonema galeatum]MCL1466719.1 hypothetical protein [Argonema galeatum A003/A1]
MKTSIEQLTLSQKSEIPPIREKWRAYALSTERIDRERAAQAVKAVYAAIGLAEPEIVFFDSPHAALRQPKNLLASFLGSLLRGKIEKELGIQQGSQLRNELEDRLSSEAIDYLKRQLWGLLAGQLGFQVGKSLWVELRNQLGSQNDNCIQPEMWASHGGLFDFYISALGWEYPPAKWEALESLVRECGWIFPWRKTCFVCDRPSKLSFDNQRLLHADAQPAIQFTDGFCLYAHHGVTIPEKYGIIPSSQWQPQWILSESDPELKLVLIQGIGMLRIRKELGNIELDL